MSKDMLTRPERRRADRAMARYERKGCAVCGAPHTIVSAVSHSKKKPGEFVVTGTGCADDTMVAFFCASRPSKDEIDGVNDRDFFVRNPERKAYVRKPQPLEAEYLTERSHMSEIAKTGTGNKTVEFAAHMRNTPDAQIAILVYNIAEGQRVREVITVPANVDLADVPEAELIERLIAHIGCKPEDLVAGATEADFAQNEHIKARAAFAGADMIGSVLNDKRDDNTAFAQAIFASSNMGVKH